MAKRRKKSRRVCVRTRNNHVVCGKPVKKTKVRRRRRRSRK